MQTRGATPASRRGATPRSRRGLTLLQLRVFVAVAEREHVTRAAHDLELAQSAVSAAVATLEGVLSVRLFDKVGRNIKLTPAGDRLLSRASALVSMADDLVDSFAATCAADGVDGAPRRSY